MTDPRMRHAVRHAVHAYVADDTPSEDSSPEDASTEDAIPGHADEYCDSMPQQFANANHDGLGDPHALGPDPPAGPQPEVVVLTVPAANLSVFAALAGRVRLWARRVARGLYDWSRGTSWRYLFPCRPLVP